MQTRILAIGKTVNGREFELEVSSLPIATNYQNCFAQPVHYERAEHLFGLGQAVYREGVRLVNRVARALYRSESQ